MYIALNDHYQPFESECTLGSLKGKLRKGCLTMIHKGNKMPYRAFSQLANWLLLNTPLLQGLLRVNKNAEKDAQC